MSRCTVMCQQRQHEEDNQENMEANFYQLFLLNVIKISLFFMNKEMHLRCNFRHNPFWVSNTKYRTETGNLHIAPLRWKQTTACICVNTVIHLQLVYSKDWSCLIQQHPLSLRHFWMKIHWMKNATSEPWWDVSDGGGHWRELILRNREEARPTITWVWKKLTSCLNIPGVSCTLTICIRPSSAWILEDVVRHHVLLVEGIRWRRTGVLF